MLTPQNQYDALLPRLRQYVPSAPRSGLILTLSAETLDELIDAAELIRAPLVAEWLRAFVKEEK